MKTAPRGWRLVPEQITEAMRQAAIENSGDERGRTGGPDDAIDRMWAAMLEAAVEPAVEAFRIVKARSE